MDGERRAVFAALYAGVAFGVFWIPIRALEGAGLPGAWASMVFTVLPALIVLPLYWTCRDQLRAANWRGLLGGVLGGAALGLYSLAFLYTDIVRVVMLFHINPVWGFLLGRIVLGEAITPTRWLAVILGLAGIAVIIGAEGGVPLPRNAGDWIALGSGIAWAFASILMLTDRNVGFVLHGASFFVFSAILNAVAVVLAGLPAPTPETVLGVLPWFLPATLILTVPAGFATIYGPTRLNPGIVGLLFMAEIAIATITAAMLTDETFGAREATGVILVIVAGLLVPFREMRGG